MSGFIQVSSSFLEDPFPLKRAEMEVTVEESNVFHVEVKDGFYSFKNGLFS